MGDVGGLHTAYVAPDMRKEGQYCDSQSLNLATLQEVFNKIGEREDQVLYEGGKEERGQYQHCK